MAWLPDLRGEVRQGEIVQGLKYHSHNKALACLPGRRMTPAVERAANGAALRECDAQSGVGSPYDPAGVTHAFDYQAKIGRHAVGRRNLKTRACLGEVAHRAFELGGLVAQNNPPRLENSPSRPDSILVHRKFFPEHNTSRGEFWKFNSTTGHSQGMSGGIRTVGSIGPGRPPLGG
jgi:hypothetical protein